jgi:hypothetical protein
MNQKTRQSPENLIKGKHYYIEVQYSSIVQAIPIRFLRLELVERKLYVRFQPLQATYYTEDLIPWHRIMGYTKQ